MMTSDRRHPVASDAASRKTCWWVAIGLVLFGSATLWAGVVVKLQTPHGTIVVEVNEPDAQVEVFTDEGKIEITRQSDAKLDPKKKYGAIIVKASNITIDGGGAWLIGAADGKPKDFKGTAIFAEGVSNVTLKNINTKGWETGLKVVNAEGFTVENCNFSDNFHDPDFGWGENGRRGGIVLERVTKSTLRKNKANRVWDACVLVDSDDNLLEENDFSYTSNTCLKLWHACRNQVTNNILSHGIRINPGEVHARDSTSVLIESGSNDNRLVKNDCTHGGDGIFVRVLNGWCSTGNHFEGNDCSYANNNCVECWSPRNTFIGNKANHGSYGFWMGGSDKSVLIGNEASHNGDPQGIHNSPHLPNNGHAGIVFMFGSSTHTVCRGNICRNNNGAGIAAIGDIESKGKKWKAQHWIIEQNRLEQNRWGVYLQYADWVHLAGNRFDGNTVRDVQDDGGVTRLTQGGANSRSGGDSPPPQANLKATTAVAELVRVQTDVARVQTEVSRLQLPVRVGEKIEIDASASRDPTGHALQFQWDFGDGATEQGSAKVAHTYSSPGFHRVGLTVSNGALSDLAWRDLYVVRDVTEIGTEGQAADWSIQDFVDRTLSNEQTSRATFDHDATERLIGDSSLRVVIAPYAGGRAALTYPKSRDAKWSLAGKTKLVFWLKAINEDVTGWQGGPFITLHGDDGQRCHIEPKPGRDLMRQLDYSEAREGWRFLEIPLSGNDQWQTDGTLPHTVHALSIAFDSWGGPTLRIWIEGLALE